MEREHKVLKLSQITFDVSEVLTPLVSDFLLGLESQGVAEDVKEDGNYRVSAYFSMDTDLAKVVNSLREYAIFLESNFPGAKVGAVTAQHIDRSHWQVWKSLLKKVRAGKKVVIIPPWERYFPQSPDVVIEINPSLAFGTGHHETTRLCIEAIEREVDEHGVESMLDVGCGSGVLSIAAARLGVNNVTGLDTDPIAVRESRKNARKNSVLDKISFFCGYIQSVRGSYKLIVANVYLEPILLMSGEFKARLGERGKLVVSGIPHIRRDEALRGLDKAGFQLNKEERQGDWLALEFLPAD